MSIPAILGIAASLFLWAGPASATLDPTTELTVNEGYTWSGYVRSSTTGPFAHSELSPIGPFTQAGDQRSFVLSHSVGEERSFFDCNPALPVVDQSRTVVDRVTLHHTFQAVSPGRLTDVSVTFGFSGDGAGVTTVFPLEALQVSVAVGGATAALWPGGAPSPGGTVTTSARCPPWRSATGG